MKQKVQTNKAPFPIGPYSQAIIAQGLVFLSGQIAIDPETNDLVTDSVENQTFRIMENVKAVLESAGSDLSKVVKCSIFLADMNDFETVNRIYASYFEEPYPAREAVQVAKLPKGVDVEISVTAIH